VAGVNGWALGELSQEDIPSAKTVSEWITKGWININERDAPWSIADGPAEDMALVLPIARSLLEIPYPRTRWPRRALAEWIVRIRRAFPDFDDMQCIYQLAWTMEAAELIAGRAETSGELDLATSLRNSTQVFLAFTPWRDEGAGLFDAIERQVIPIDVAHEFGWEDSYLSWRGQQGLATQGEARSGQG